MTFALLKIVIVKMLIAVVCFSKYQTHGFTLGKCHKLYIDGLYTFFMCVLCGDGGLGHGGHGGGWSP